MLDVKSPDDQLRDLYHFFVNAEINNEEVMDSQIQKRLVDRNDNEIYWYAKS